MIYRFFKFNRLITIISSEERRVPHGAKYVQPFFILVKWHIIKIELSVFLNEGEDNVRFLKNLKEVLSKKGWGTLNYMNKI